MTTEVPILSPRSRAMWFFSIPPALQATARVLPYPLVTMVASRDAGGPLNLAGLAQSQIVMFLIGTLGAGLVTTGMVLGRTRSGFGKELLMMLECRFLPR